MAGLRTAAVLVGLHYAVNLAHGVAHGGVPVPLTTAQTAFVLAVVTIGPIAALMLLRRGRSALGWTVLATLLLASFLFGVAFHYVVVSPDHVANVPAGAWKLPFEATAALVAVVEGGGAVLAAWYARQFQRGGPTGSIDSTT